jgi:hypothetical protein
MGFDLKYGRVTTERGSIGWDEPVIIFRAQDRFMLKVLKFYRWLIEIGTGSTIMLDLLDRQANNVKAWQVTHDTKIPD